MRRIPASRLLRPRRRPLARCVHSVTTSDIQWFKALLGDRYAVSKEEDSDLLVRHSSDWSNRWVASPASAAPVVLYPGNAEAVSQIVEYAAKRGIPIVPQGGNTGLVGGSTPIDGSEIILSLSRMNKILRLDTVEGLLVCEAGCVLQQIQDAALEAGFEVPVDLGAKGSCQIGGNLATHAGGIRFVRHGPLRAHVLELGVVDGRGRALTLGSRMRKDNTGYDLKQLFVGSEGTLGVITHVALALPRAAPDRQVAMLAMPSFAAAVSAVSTAKRVVGEAIGAVEWVDQRAMRHVLQHFPATHTPAVFGDVQMMKDDAFAKGGYILVEVSGAVARHDKEKLEAYFEALLEGGDDACSDAVLAQDAKQATGLWNIREGCAVALTGSGYICYK